MLMGALLYAPFFGLSQSASNAEFPIILNLDGQKVVAEKGVIHVWAESISSPSENKEAPNPVFAFFENKLKANAAKPEELAKFLSNENDAKRAAKFLEMMGDKAKVNLCINAGEACILLFFTSENSKLRPDMNYLAIKGKSANDFKWDLSEKSLLTCMISESVRFGKIKFFKDERKVKSGLSINTLELTHGKNADAPAFVFYQKAQKEFYDMKLAEYAKFMTPKSKEVYSSQFLSMTPQEQEKTLEDYIQWHKTFFKIYDLGQVKIISFKRMKECGTYTMYDCAFLLENKGEFALANFGQNQGLLADEIVKELKESGE